MLKSSKTTQRRGFTLIELLPAVQKVREAANRMACANNLKNLGLALHNYHDTFKKFPPGAVGPVGSFPQFAGLKQHGLGTYLLPYLEQDALASQYCWDVSWFDPPNQPVVTTPLKIWQCPSAESNRFEDGSLITVTPPPGTLFNGTAACGDYAGMSRV